MRVLLMAVVLAFAMSPASAQPGGGPPFMPPAGPPSLPPAAGARYGPPEIPRPDRASEAYDQAQEMRQRAQEEGSARRAAAKGYGAADVLAAYERDADGQWFKRGEIVVAGADAATMARGQHGPHRAPPHHALLCRP